MTCPVWRCPMSSAASLEELQVSQQPGGREVPLAGVECGPARVEVGSPCGGKGSQQPPLSQAPVFILAPGCRPLWG